MSKRKQSTPRQFQNGSDPRLATGSSAGGEDNSAALMESEDHNESEADMTDSVSTTATPATGDIHVCGSCQAEFKSLERFLRHKEACVRSTSQDDVIALSPSEMPASSNGPVGTCETPLSVQSMFSEIQKQHMALLQMLQKLLMKIGDSRTGICMHGRNGTVANLDLLTSPESGIGSGTEGDGSSRRDFVCPVERQCFSDLKSFLDHLQHHQKMQASSSDGPRLGRKYDETSIMNANKISTSDKQKSSLSAEIVCANSPYSDAEERIDNGEEDGMDDGESDDGKGGDMTPVGPDGQPLDPASYMALLPTPGSNDSSWEQLMEIAAPIETTRLREMVDRIDDKRDPHECGICKRVLSCKSALQMHYRTHTGERPFRCKLCRRAFTTKGNLKTHMGVHRTKLVGATNSISIPSEMPNLMALQQRLMEQNHLLSDGPGNSGALPSLFGSASVHDFRSHAASLRSDWPLQAPSTQTSFQSLEALIQRTTGGHSAGNNNFEERLPMDLSASQNGNGRSENDDNDSQSIKSEDENDADDTRESLNFREIDGTSQNAMASPENGMALDLTPRSNSVTRISPDGEMLNGTRLTSPRNTTCHVCYKTFACQSALQIHFRSHTKERPFTCPICKRGFSTKGNMKQHLLTHKIRELPPHSQHSSHSVGSPMEECSQPSEDAKPLLESTGSTASSVKHQQQDDDSNSIISKDNNNNNAALLPANTAAGLSGTGGSGSINGAASQRRSGYAKNVCHVCDKPFSSNSALQIHMRTHTGEKPFVCDKCGRAFTTKGNLKVHMGTHMWNDTSSTLRRRNSSADPDLPLPKRHASDRDSSSSQPLPHPMNPSSLSASAGMNPINSFYPGMSNFNEMQRKLLDSYSASVGLQSSPMFFPYAAMFNGMVGKMGLTNPAAANLYAAQAAISGLGPNGYFGMNSAMPGFDMAAMGKRIHDAQSGDSAGSRSPRSSDTPESRQSNESGETVPVRSGGRESSGAVTVPK